VTSRQRSRAFLVILCAIKAGGVVAKSSVLALLASGPAHATVVEYPHASANHITCAACHPSPGALYPPYAPFVARNSDDTPANNLCWSCHNDMEAPFVRTHSSLTTGSQRGSWSLECVVCHDQHQQAQPHAYGPESYAFSAPVAAIGTSTIQQATASWSPGQWAGWLVMGNVTHPDIYYRIVSNTTDTLTVESTVDPSVVTVGGTFALLYGKLIRSTVASPNSGAKSVKLFGPTGGHSLADGDSTLDGICEVCHTQTTHYRNDGSGPDQHHANVGGADGRRCAECHSHKAGFAHGLGGGSGQGCGTATSCHGAQASHPTHVGGAQLALDCGTCHDTSAFPAFKDGEGLSGTHVCDGCHTAAGATLAKQYWRYPGSDLHTAGSWAVVEGERSFCGSCHQALGGNTQADGSGSPAPNVIGDDATYGYYITGHGKGSATYARMAWQDIAASGNPAAVLSCQACHDLTSAHFGNPTKRLRTGYANDQANSNCKNCHSWDSSEGTVATAPPHFYTTSAEYESGAHRDQLCTDCHDVHGATGAYAGMTRVEREGLCYSCHRDHTAGGIENDAISGPALASDIQQAFSLPFKHGLGTTFPQNGNTYTLQCTSCHNVHIVTGKYTQAAQGMSPITRLSAITSLWGAAGGQKMSDYAGSGTYQTPAGDLFAGNVLPDYASFCSDCHNSSTTIYSPSLGRNLAAFDWNSEKHGTRPATLSNSVLSAPYQLSLLGEYVASCTDCHEAHGSTNNYAIRTVVNNGPVTVTQDGQALGGREWDSLCQRCHGTVSDVMAVHGTVWPDPNDCMSCHNFHPDPYTNCAVCHTHGVDPYALSTPTVTPTATPTATP